MEEAIKNFNKQFSWHPEIENLDNLEKRSRFLVVGMGGSRLAADVIKNWHPETPIKLWHNYDLPVLPKEEWGETLVILSSYSGNTEETLDAFRVAGKKSLPRAVVTKGGELLRLAQKENIPYIQIPDTGIQPRMALGFSLRAFLKFMNEDVLLKKSEKLAKILNPLEHEKNGREMSEKLKGHVPVIYSSDRNYTISYNWKIKINETGKVPAFFNVLPKMNHNEMISFDVIESTKDLSRIFYFIILKDHGDNPRVVKRMEIMAKMYKERGLKYEIIEIKGKNRLHKILNCLLLADWVAYFLAKSYGIEPQEVPMVEEFKKLI